MSTFEITIARKTDEGWPVVVERTSPGSVMRVRAEAFAQAARHAGVTVSSIGTVVAGSAVPKFIDGQGREIALERLSYSHF